MADVPIVDGMGWVFIGSGDRAVPGQPGPISGTTVALQGDGAGVEGITWIKAAPNPGGGEACVRGYAYDDMYVVDCHSTVTEPTSPPSLDRCGFLYSDGARNLRILDCTTGPLGAGMPFDHSCYLNGVARSATAFVEGCDFRENLGAPIHVYATSSQVTVRNCQLGGYAWGAVADGPGCYALVEYCNIFDQGVLQEGGYTSRAGLEACRNGGAIDYRNCTFANNYNNTLCNVTLLAAGPDRVTNPVAIPSGSQVALSWTNPASFTTIEVRRSTTEYPRELTDGALVYSGTGESHLDTGLQAGQTYYYSIFAVNAASYAPAATVSTEPGGPGVPWPPEDALFYGMILESTAGAVTNPGDLVVSPWPDGGSGPHRHTSTAPTQGTEQIGVYNSLPLYPGTSYATAVLDPPSEEQFSFGEWDGTAGGMTDPSQVQDHGEINYLTFGFRFWEYTANTIKLLWAEHTNPGTPGDSNKAFEFGLPKTGAPPDGLHMTTRGGELTAQQVNQAQVEATIETGTFYRAILGYKAAPDNTGWARLWIAKEGSPIPGEGAPTVEMLDIPTAILDGATPLPLSWRCGWKIDPGDRIDGATLGYARFDNYAAARNVWDYYEGAPVVPTIGLAAPPPPPAVPGIDLPPDPVVNFTVTPSNEKNFLMWTNPVSGFDEVQVVRKTGGYPTNPADGTLVYNGPAESFNDLPLVNGTTYYYAIWSVRDSIYALDAAQALGTPSGGIVATVRYPKGMEDQVMIGGVNFATDAFIVLLLDSGYVYDAAHNYLNDIPAPNRVATSGPVTGKTVTNGYFDFDDPTISAVTGNNVTQVVVAKTTGDDATSPLILYIDEDQATNPINFPPNGSDVDVIIPAGGFPICGN